MAVPGGDHLTANNARPPVVSRFDGIYPERLQGLSGRLVPRPGRGTWLPGWSLLDNSKKRAIAAVWFAVHEYPVEAPGHRRPPRRDAVDVLAPRLRGAREHGLLVAGQRGLDVAGVRGDGLAELGSVQHGDVGVFAVRGREVGGVTDQGHPGHPGPAVPGRQRVKGTRGTVRARTAQGEPRRVDLVRAAARLTWHPALAMVDSPSSGRRHGAGACTRLSLADPPSCLGGTGALRRTSPKRAGPGRLPCPTGAKSARRNRPARGTVSGNVLFLRRPCRC
jgi:hypothetical protein